MIYCSTISISTLIDCAFIIRSEGIFIMCGNHGSKRFPIVVSEVVATGAIFVLIEVGSEFLVESIVTHICSVTNIPTNLTSWSISTHTLSSIFELISSVLPTVLTSATSMAL